MRRPSSRTRFSTVVPRGLAAADARGAVAGPACRRPAWNCSTRYRKVKAARAPYQAPKRWPAAVSAQEVARRSAKAWRTAAQQAVRRAMVSPRASWKADSQAEAKSKAGATAAGGRSAAAGKSAYPERFFERQAKVKVRPHASSMKTRSPGDRKMDALACRLTRSRIGVMMWKVAILATKLQLERPLPPCFIHLLLSASTCHKRKRRNQKHAAAVATCFFQ